MNLINARMIKSFDKLESKVITIITVDRFIIIAYLLSFGVLINY